MALAGAIWLGLTLFGLAIGMIGYAAFENMSATDAYVNAAMILSAAGAQTELNLRQKSSPAPTRFFQVC